MTVTVHVTQKHIDEGKIGQCKRCPIALGIKEIFPALDVQVGKTAVHIDVPPAVLRDTYRYARIPKEAEDFISAFDQGVNVKPFSFPLDVRHELAPYLNPSLGSDDNILEI